MRKILRVATCGAFVDFASFTNAVRAGALRARVYFVTAATDCAERSAGCTAMGAILKDGAVCVAGATNGSRNSALVVGTARVATSAGQLGVAEIVCPAFGETETTD